MFTRFNKTLNDRRAGLEREEGFTLIELLVVVIIIGILAAIAIPVYLGIQENAKDSAIKSDLGNAKTAVVAYFTATPGATAAPTLDVATLDKYGFSQSLDNVIAYKGSGPASSVAAFCIDGSRTSAGADVTHRFKVTDKDGVTAGSCP